MSFEERSLERADAEKAFRKAESVASEWRIKETDFVDPYGKESVKRDTDKVKRLKEKFGEKSEVERESEVFEVIIFHQTELQNWLGPDAHTFLPSEYDDIVNGVDCIVEFQDEERGVKHLGFAIDVTFSTDPSVISDKLERIEDEIRSGDLTEVKYFQSEEMGYKGKLERMPRVVIGADRGTVKELSQLWLNKDNNELQKHWIQDLILEEARIQLKAFLEYAKSMNREKAVKAYKKVLNTVNAVIKEKGAINAYDLAEKDATFREIQRMVE